MTQAEAPTHTLTFLFTDVEGSTGLWERYPEPMRQALGLHDGILRRAIEEAGGRVVKTMGDGVMAAFSSSREGLSASITAQLALRDAVWPETGPLRVRMGLHAGEVAGTGDDYHGPAVNRAARIMAAGHGGQILLSQAAATLVQDDLPGSWSLLDLGEHQLKGLGRPERVYQVVHPDLQREFPRLTTPEGLSTGLPVESSAFVGRAAELQQLIERLERPATRLVTLTGPGGIGKTRLALRAADDVQPTFSDGAAFVDLSAATDTPSVLLAIARAVGLPDRSAQEQLDELVERLREQERLLVLDNFEQAASAAPAIATILGECPRIKVLATSRETLKVRGEHVVPVQPMGLPDDATALSLEALAAFESVQLFVERAQAVKPDFQLTEDNAAAVAEICRRLDGLPLAIELATGRIGIFSPQKLLARLTSRLDLLKGGARDLPERQRTLRGTIEWSYELLAPEEQRLLALLSVFAGADFEAIEAVAGSLEETAAELDLIDGLGSLTDKSLVQQLELDDGSARFTMLGTIREYATDRLDVEPALAAAVRAGHASYYMDQAAVMAERLAGPEREGALLAVALERGNLDACWKHWLAEGDQARLDDLIDALWPLYDARGWYQAMLDIGSDMLSVLERGPTSPERTKAELALRMSLGRTLLAMQGYTSEAEAAFQAAMQLLGDAPETLQAFPVLRSLAGFHIYRAEFDKAAEIGQRILDLAEETDDDSMRLEGRFIVGANIAFLGDPAGSAKLLDEAIEGFDTHAYRAGRYRSGNDPRVTSLTTSALVLWLLGRIDESLRRADRALELAAELAHPPSLAYARHHSCLLHFMRGELELVEDRARGVVEIAEGEDLEIWRAIGTCMMGVAMAGRGQADEGLDRISEGMALYRGLKTPPVFWPLLLHVRSWACVSAGRWQDGRVYIDEAISLGGNGGPFAGELHLLRGDLIGEGVPIDHHAGRERVEAYERAFLLSGESKTITPQLHAATRRVQVTAPDSDEAALERSLSDLYGRFDEGLDTAILVEARQVLEERGAV